MISRILSGKAPGLAASLGDLDAAVMRPAIVEEARDEELARINQSVPSREFMRAYCRATCTPFLGGQSRDWADDFKSAHALADSRYELDADRAALAARDLPGFLTNRDALIRAYEAEPDRLLKPEADDEQA